MDGSKTRVLICPRRGWQPESPPSTRGSVEFSRPILNVGRDLGIWWLGRSVLYHSNLEGEDASTSRRLDSCCCVRDPHGSFRLPGRRRGTQACFLSQPFRCSDGPASEVRRVGQQLLLPGGVVLGELRHLCLG